MDRHPRSRYSEFLLTFGKHYAIVACERRLSTLPDVPPPELVASIARSWPAVRKSSFRNSPIFNAMLRRPGYTPKFFSVLQLFFSPQLCASARDSIFAAVPHQHAHSTQLPK